MKRKHRKMQNRRVGARIEALRTVGRVLLMTGRRAARLVAVALLVAGGGAGLLAAVDYVRTGPYFRVRDVRVQGISRVPEAAILARAGVQPGVTLSLGLDPHAMARAVEAHPVVLSATVDRKLPSRLTIRVTERTPVAVLLQDGQPLLIDGYGRLLGEPQNPGDVDRPIVSGLDAEAVRRGQGGVRRDLQIALSTLRDWQRHGMDEVDGLSEVRVDPVMGITVVTADDGTEIRLGHSEISERLARLKPVLAHLRRSGRRAEYVLADDERDPGRLIVRAVDRQNTQAKADPDGDGSGKRRQDGTQG